MPNNDTLYSSGWLDLRTEPIVLSLPNVPESRYYSIQLNDSYTHNFAILGSHSTGNNPGLYMVAGLNWNSSSPEGICKCYQSDSEFVHLLGRVQVNGVDDIPTIQAIQEKLTFTPLSSFLGQEAPSPCPLPQFPPFDEKKLNTLDYFQYVNFFMHFVKIHPSEKESFERFSCIDIIPGADYSPDVSLVEPVKKGMASGDTAVQMAFLSVKRIEKNGWIAVIQPPMFGSRQVMQGRYNTRALAATVGLYGLDPDEACYYKCDSGSDKMQLDVSKKHYTLTFIKGNIPNVKGFWSVTLYNKQLLLIDNAINRYSIGDRTQGLRIAEDGFLTLSIQSNVPADQSNWLPAPKGPFCLSMRLYWPLSGAKEDPYIPPPLTVVTE